MDLLTTLYHDSRTTLDRIWERRDRRVDGWWLMDSPIPTFVLCAAYVYAVKVAGPRFMKDRKPYNIRMFLIIYNAFQVVFSTFIFVELLRYGWWNDYSFRCQPVDFSDNPRAVYMAHICWWYFFSKFTEFLDTFAFVARKKFSHVSLLHVVHHGLMPMSVWPGARFFPGGHASFFGLLNTFVHIFMYFYYMVAAMGPQYSQYIWWKQHMTNLQMFQFIGIMVHGFQLAFYDDCDFPWQLSIYIGAHAVLFFILFAQFYIQAYMNKSHKQIKASSNGVSKVPHANNHTSKSPSNGFHPTDLTSQQDGPYATRLRPRQLNGNQFL